MELVVRNEWGRREEGGLELKQALFISSISVKQKLASHEDIREKIIKGKSWHCTNTTLCACLVKQ